MKNLKKKGFTIVELVIVIAVIAILSAVLIPTFSNLIRKANVSADTQLVKQLNQALAIEEVENGKNVTMHDALETVKEYGFDIAKINAKANLNEILWDSKNNIFVYFDADADKIVYIPNAEPDDKGEGAELWKIYNDEDETPAKDAQVYSIYWNKTAAFVGEVVVGFDAGNTEENEVTYTGTADATLRTNGGIVKVNAPQATVNHYGLADEVYVGQVSANTYNLFGDVAYMEVAAGQHVVLKEGSSVSGIYAEDGANANIELNNGQPNEVISADKEAIKAAATMFAGGLGTAEKPFLIANVEHMQNISKKYDTYNYYKVADGVEVLNCEKWNSIKLNGSFDGNGVTLNNVSDSLFSNAAGDLVSIKNINLNVKISKSEGIGAVVDKSNTLNLIVDSVNVSGLIIGSSWVTPYVQFGPGAEKTWNLTIKNSVSDATLVATTGVASGFVGHPYNKVSQGDLNDTSLISIVDSAYIGNMSATGNVNNYNFKYFTINGNSNRVRTYYSSEFINTLGYNPEGTLYDIISDSNDYPVIIENESKTFFCGNYGKNLVDIYKLSDNKNVLNTTSQSTLPNNIGDLFEIKKVTGATKAIISLEIAPNDSNNYGSYLGIYMTEEIDIANVDSFFSSSNIKYFTININSGVTEESGVSGNIFNVVNPNYGKNAYNYAGVNIIQYDISGNVLNITTIKIADEHLAE